MNILPHPPSSVGVDPRERAGVPRRRLLQGVAVVLAIGGGVFAATKGHAQATPGTAPKPAPGPGAPTAPTAAAAPGSAAPLPAVAVPYYGASAFIAAMLAHGHLPRAQAFEREAKALAAAFAAGCGDPQALRAAWRRTTSAWDALNGVAFGPVVQRRSAARRIDFWPTRPETLKRTLAKPPADLKALERVGAPAKGLPALEALLWPQPPQGAACAYAALLAQDIVLEATAVREGFEASANVDRDEDGEGSSALAGEWLNQWVAGLEALRWRMLGKPLAAQGHADFPREASGSTGATWLASWRTLRDTAIGAAPNNGFGPAPDVPPGVVSLEALLRGRGENAVADTFVAAVRRADAALAPLEGAGPRATPAAEQALKALTEVKATVEAKVASALQVSLGFSDADGD